MLRIPFEVVEEARRLAVETSLRMYVVGGLAAYAAHKSQDEPKDYDLIVVGDRYSYEMYENNLTKVDEDDSYTIPFLPPSPRMDLTRTRFGGLRILNAGGPHVDLWHESSVVDYLNLSDKGDNYVVDPVTAIVYHRAESPVESADVYVDGKYEFDMRFEARWGKGWYSDAVDERLQGWRLDPGTHKVELREPGTHKVIRDWIYTREVVKQSAPTVPATVPATVQGTVRWCGHIGADVPITLPAVKLESNAADHVRAGLSALAKAGRIPSSPVSLVFLPLGSTIDGSAREYNVAGRSDVDEWHVADGSGQSFKVYLPKGDHPRNYHDGLTKMAKDRLPHAAYVTATLPGTYDSYGWRIPGVPLRKPKPQYTWAVWIDGAIRPPRFQMDADASDAAVREEARRVWRGQGGLCLPGNWLKLQRSGENGALSGPVTTFRI